MTLNETKVWIFPRIAHKVCVVHSYSALPTLHFRVFINKKASQSQHRTLNSVIKHISALHHRIQCDHRGPT